MPDILGLMTDEELLAHQQAKQQEVAASQQQAQMAAEHPYLWAASSVPMVGPLMRGGAGISESIGRAAFGAEDPESTHQTLSTGVQAAQQALRDKQSIPGAATAINTASELAPWLLNPVGTAAATGGDISANLQERGVNPWLSLGVGTGAGVASLAVPAGAGALATRVGATALAEGAGRMAVDSTINKFLPAVNGAATRVFAEKMAGTVPTNMLMGAGIPLVEGAIESGASALPGVSDQDAQILQEEAAAKASPANLWESAVGAIPLGLLHTPQAMRAGNQAAVRAKAEELRPEMRGVREAQTRMPEDVVAGIDQKLTEGTAAQTAPLEMVEAERQRLAAEASQPPAPDIAAQEQARQAQEAEARNFEATRIRNEQEQAAATQAKQAEYAQRVQAEEAEANTQALADRPQAQAAVTELAAAERDLASAKAAHDQARKAVMEPGRAAEAPVLRQQLIAAKKNLDAAAVNAKAKRSAAEAYEARTAPERVGEVDDAKSFMAATAKDLRSSGMTPEDFVASLHPSHRKMVAEHLATLQKTQPSMYPRLTAALKASNAPPPKTAPTSARPAAPRRAPAAPRAGESGGGRVGDLPVPEVRVQGAGERVRSEPAPAADAERGGGEVGGTGVEEPGITPGRAAKVRTDIEGASRSRTLKDTPAEVPKVKGEEELTPAERREASVTHAAEKEKAAQEALKTRLSEEEAAAKAESDRKTKEVDRLAKAVDTGAKESLGPKAATTVEDGKIVVRHDGEHFVTFNPSFEKVKGEDIDPKSWWNSIKIADFWNNRRSKIEKIIDKKKSTPPRSFEEFMSTYSPEVRARIMELKPPEATYDSKTGEVTLHNVAEMGDVAAIESGRHESNHKLVHGVIKASLLGRSRAEIDALERLTKTKYDPNDSKFLEAVYDKYAAWRKVHPTLRAGEAKKEATGLFASISRKLKWLLRTARIIGPDTTMTFNDVFQKMAAGELTDVAAKAHKELPGSDGKAYKLSEEDKIAAGRSMGDLPEDARGIQEKLNEKAAIARDAMRTSMEKVDKDAEQREKDVGRERAVQDAIDAAYTSEGSAGPMHERVLMRELNRIYEDYGAGKMSLEKTVERASEVNDAYYLSRTHAGQALALGRDQIEGPEQRANAVRNITFRPSEKVSAKLRKLDKEIRAGSSQAKAQRDAIIKRMNARNLKTVETIREKYGIDIMSPSFKDMMTSHEAYRVADDIVGSERNWTAADWIEANYRAGLLSDPIQTQTQQVTSNGITGLSRVLLDIPASIWESMLTRSTIPMGAAIAQKAAFNGYMRREVFKNLVESYKLGENAYVRDQRSTHLGSFESEGHVQPTDKYSRFMQAISFKPMAAIDGAANRFAAHVELVKEVYKAERKEGKSHADAMETATAVGRGEIEPPASLEYEALMKSLPATFQDLAVVREGERGEGLAGNLGKFQGWASDTLNKVNIPIGVRDPITGDMQAIRAKTILMPFVRTAVSLAKYSMKLNPITGAAYMGVKGAAGGYGKAHESAAKDMSDILAGSAAMFALAAYLRPVGTEGDKDEAFQRRTGTMSAEKTFKLFGVDVPYGRLEPFATALAAAANVHDRLARGEDLPHATIEGTLNAYAKLGSDLAWFRAFMAPVDAVKAASDEKGDAAAKTGAATSKFVAQTLASAIPSVVKNWAIDHGTPSRPGEGFVGNLATASKVGGEPFIDIYGREVERGTSNRLIKGALGTKVEMRQTPLDRELADFNAKLPIDQQIVMKSWKDEKWMDEEDGVVEKLTPKQQTEYEKVAGRMFLSEAPDLASDMRDMADEYRSTDDKDEKAAILKAMRGTINKVRKALRSEALDQVMNGP